MRDVWINYGFYIELHRFSKGRIRRKEEKEEKLDNYCVFIGGLCKTAVYVLYTTI